MPRCEGAAHPIIFIIMTEYEYNDYQNLKAKYLTLEDEVKSLRHEMFHADAYMGELHNWIKSDSVYTLLRYGSKSPSSSGVDDCEDDCYQDLYNLSVSLRKADREENEARKDSFDQQLP
jgi:hypothetical protein